MNQPKLLERLNLLELTILGFIAISEITTFSVQAAQLDFEDKTSDFFDDIVVINNGVGTFTGNNFSITFNSESLVAVSSSSEEFFPFFPSNSDLFGINSPTVNFEFTTIININLNGFDEAAEYVLVNDLIFIFDNGITITIGQGTTFLFEIDKSSDGRPENVGGDFEILSSKSNVTIPGFAPFTIGSDTNTLTNLEFSLSDLATVGGGAYEAEVSVKSNTPVPESSTVFGLLAIAFLGLMRYT